MTVGFLLLVVPTVISELNGNPAIEKWVAQTGYGRQKFVLDPPFLDFGALLHRNSTGR
jgi:hypothetical protein